MKALRNIAMLLLIATGFAYSQDITVQGEKKLNTDFTKYKSFGWVQAEKPGKHLIAYTYEDVTPVKDSNGDVVVYSYMYTIPSVDSAINRTVERSVNEELEGRGYRHTDVNPDLLVAFKIFDQSTKIKGYNAPPTQVAGDVETHQPQDTVTYKLRRGSIFISLIDAKSGTVVWEGYASGVARPNDAINDKLKVKQAVNLIFKKYEFRGDKYSMNN